MVEIFTEADTLPELRKEILDAVRCHYSEEPSRPKIARLLHLVKDEILPV